MDREILRTWKLYEGRVLVDKTKPEQDAGYMGFLAGWICCYKFMWGLIASPTKDSSNKLLDLQKEISEIMDEIDKRTLKR
jgi:hypothetical protein